MSILLSFKDSLVDICRVCERVFFVYSEQCSLIHLTKSNSCRSQHMNDSWTHVSACAVEVHGCI